ncbi:hypothetical protein [Novipirellula aureliae]|uniref:hypothetical protein n=1 Tax=Novipirellula aureliae TaxID=2527966 RepID=UPI0011B3D61F|nr:hypothetical protein [Novipirellula aureliae]
MQQKAYQIQVGLQLLKHEIARSSHKAQAIAPSEINFGFLSHALLHFLGLQENIFRNRPAKRFPHLSIAKVVFFGRL